MLVTKRWLLALATMTAIGVAACGGSDPSFPVTDARELLTKVVDRAIALERVHLDLQLAESGNILGGPESGTLQGDFDVANGELTLTAQSSEAAAAPVGLVITDGMVFTSNGGRWDAQPLGPGLGEGVLGMLPAREQLDAAFRAMAADKRVVLELREPVDCAVGKCYALVVTVPPQVLWDHLGPPLNPLIGSPPTLPGDVPAVQLLVHAAPETFDFVRIELVFAPSSGRVRLIVDASKHDQPMEVVAPQ